MGDNSQSHSSAPESFTTMSVGDIDSIGAHCQAAFCHQLDFLPFRCESCKGKFCLDHRTEDAHNCSNKGAWARSRLQASAASAPLPSKPTIRNHESQCSATSCKTLINTPLVPGIDCPTCRRSYCLRHRMKEDHNCANLTPLVLGREQSQQQSFASALGKLKQWGASKKAAMAAPSSSSLSKTKTSTSTSSETPFTSGATTSRLARIVSPFTLARSSKQSSKTAQIVAVNKLKQSAKGDSKVPAEKRIYVHLEAVASGEGHAGAKVPKGDAFYSNDWSIGKILDSAAKQLSVENVNNRGGGEEQKLRVFHIEGGRVLPFSEKLGATKVNNGDTLVLLRGIGDGETSLIQL